MRPVRILAFGVVGLSAALLFPLVQTYVLYTIALTPLVLLLLGQFYLPRSKRSIRVWFNPELMELLEELSALEPDTPLLRLSGKNIGFGVFKQWHEFAIVTHRFWLLGGIGLTSLLMVWFVWHVQQELFSGMAFFYVTGSVWLWLVLLAMRWSWERRMLRREGVTIGDFSVEGGSKPPYRRIRYHFIDPSGHHWGGIFDSLFCDRADDMTVIFYDEANPDRSVPASALIFHKLVWKEQPDRAAAESA